MCFLFYFGNCHPVLHPLSCQVSLLFDCLPCLYVFHLSLCVSPLTLSNRLLFTPGPVLVYRAPSFSMWNCAVTHYFSCFSCFLRIFLSFLNQLITKATLCNFDWAPLLQKTKLNYTCLYIAKNNNLSKTRSYLMEMMSYSCSASTLWFMEVPESNM